MSQLKRPSKLNEIKHSKKAVGLNSAKTVNNFLSQADVPSWYRGISSFQLAAADQLFIALRDDKEQESTHRTREVLHSIGLKPSISSKELTYLIRLCRGNDLAFLWFLMDMKYTTPGRPAKYSTNEQLIMTAIAHLDTVPTLRELDRILPKYVPLQKKKKQQTINYLPSRCGYSKNPDSLPYFKMQVRPLKYGKTQALPEPKFRVNFGDYENYKDPRYVLPNEYNRWYATYKLGAGKRAVKHIIHDEIDNVVARETGNLLLGRTGSRDVVNRKMLCQHHKELEILLQTTKNKATETCLKSLDVLRKQREATEARIMAQLEQDVENYVVRSKNFKLKFPNKTLVKVIAGNCVCCAKLIDNISTVCDLERGIICKPENKDNERQKYSETFVEERPVGCDPRIKTKKTDLKLFERNIDKNCTMEDFVDICADETVSKTTSEVFFHAPSDHTPYCFDYDKIFNFDSDVSASVCVNNSFAKALDSQTSIRLGMQPDINKAAKTCASKIWNDQVSIRSAEIEREEEERNALIKKDPEMNELTIFKQKYPDKYYDSKDTKLMEQMLIDALKHMAKKKRYILATLPNAHKYPLLREWIIARFGHAYTRTERVKSYWKSLQVFQALNMIPLQAPVVKIEDIGTSSTVDYSCRDYIVKKSAFIKDRYKQVLDNSVMERVRILWYTMMPYQCSNGPPIHTYFAYMPAKVLNIQTFRPWRSTEYTNYKEIRRKQIAEEET